MAQFSVKTNQIRQLSEEEEQLARELREIESSINSVRSNLSFKISARYNIRSRLRSTSNSVGSQRIGMSRMHSALSEVVNTYERAERQASSNSGSINNSEINDLVGIAAQMPTMDIYNRPFDVKQIVEWLHTGKMPEGIMHRLEDVRTFLADAYESGFLGLNTLIPLSQLAIGNVKQIQSKIGEMQDFLYDKTSFEAETRTEGAVVDWKAVSQNGSLGVTALAYEAYAKANGGLLEKDKDGNLVFNPNVSAKAGASFTALEIEGEYSVGDDFFGAGASGHITAGKVSGEVNGSAALRDNDGNINPHAQLHANAEAILVDAKAQAGVTVLGTEAEVTGSVNIGAGAHADVEIGDGKIKCDIGLSLGIGFSLSVSIDYGGTVKAVQKTAESILNKLKFW